MIWAELHRTASSKVLYANPPDWRQMLAWRRRLDPGQVFIDVGANIGVYTIFAVELGAHVIAVEPSSMVSHRLRENLALNGYEAELHEVVLSNQPGTVLFDDSLDVLGHISNAGVEKRAETLDRLLGARHAAGVKIDVEGAERLVLEGAMRALHEHRIDCLQIEWNRCSADLLGESRAPIAQMLLDCGYLLYRPDDRGELWPADVSGYGPDLFALANPP